MWGKDTTITGSWETSKSVGTLVRSKGDPLRGFHLREPIIISILFRSNTMDLVRYHHASSTTARGCRARHVSVYICGKRGARKCNIGKESLDGLRHCDNPKVDPSLSMKQASFSSLLLSWYRYI